jgi:hypothetical protein
MLAASIRARATFQAALVAGCRTARPLTPADTNILCFSVAKDGETLSAANARTEDLFARFRKDHGFSLSKTILSTESYAAMIDAHVQTYAGVRDAGELVLLRCVFMNPFWSDPATSAYLMPRLIETLNGFLSSQRDDFDTADRTPVAST